ncbi:hypothetical protein Q0F99_19170 [Rathayibacter oskolensis]|uniref:hypothetical protein n=1 Tax=Rathayibacter oskolensis TaxID=1891671 RepID=UPI00265EEDC1|nr:hypothetical protein [Rathayibacter oskolensis]WKK71462.1 hypothetical protein Q0F99_19170 [Rathayibacter oskolensis]
MVVTAAFWDILFSDENTRAFVGSLTDAVPIVITAALTLGATLLTTKIADDRRRKDAEALAILTANERRQERTLEHDREDRVKWHFDLRDQAAEILALASRAAVFTRAGVGKPPTDILPGESHEDHLVRSRGVYAEGLAMSSAISTTFMKFYLISNAELSSTCGNLVQAANGMLKMDEDLQDSYKAYSAANPKFASAVWKYLSAEMRNTP